MSPVTFLKSPPLWMHSMWKYNCNVSFAPNFSFELVMRKWKRFRVPDGFSLKHVRYIGSGGESNLRETMEEFEKVMAQYELEQYSVSDEANITQ
mmetsp:Transcript_17745/g.28907  ORF Transcript_17745/g.28907 Transcript_17745/m.28907 type:complete len:94 (+) Transcript_17745:924-1205(+)